MKIQKIDKLFTVWESRKMLCVISTKDGILLGCLELGRCKHLGL